jgi:hypothetical protein
MLGRVDKTTDTGAYEPNVLGTIATLVANHHSATVGSQQVDYAGADAAADTAYLNVQLIGVDTHSMA